VLVESFHRLTSEEASPHSVRLFSRLFDVRSPTRLASFLMPPALRPDRAEPTLCECCLLPPLQAAGRHVVAKAAAELHRFHVLPAGRKKVAEGVAHRVERAVALQCVVAQRGSANAGIWSSSHQQSTRRVSQPAALPERALLLRTSSRVSCSCPRATATPSSMTTRSVPLRQPQGCTRTGRERPRRAETARDRAGNVGETDAAEVTIPSLAAAMSTLASSARASHTS